MKAARTWTWTLLVALAAFPAQAQEQEGDSEAGSDPVKERILWQRATRDEPYVFQAFKQNYVLPASYVTDINDSPSTAGLSGSSRFQDAEVKFQFSIRVNLWPDIVNERTSVSFGYTQLSLFQAYNGGASRPFRETNYSPEIWFDYLFAGEPAGLFEARVLRIGYQHESNGRQEPLSRSWDRVYVDLIFEVGRVAVSLRPWYRLPEKDSRDDNPDIHEYMGYGDLVLVYPRGGHTVSALLRNNLDTASNRGAVELGYSFPLAGQLRGYLQVFSGYGESLIDYNHSATRVSLGIMLHDWL
ncbi:phospholipase A [Ectothiorhodospiraceae bacterium WFHF3C12]|nr:phospholipase A [Ectothiorhodospiraceae bacterium WFHF3C12]